MEQIHSDRVDLLMWEKTQTKAKKPWEVVTPWDDKGNCKFTYGAGNGSRKPQPEVVFTDVNGERLDQDQLSLIKLGIEGLPDGGAKAIPEGGQLGKTPQNSRGYQSASHRDEGTGGGSAT